MERIKHVFLLFAILFSSVAVVKAQQDPIPAPDKLDWEVVNIAVDKTTPSPVPVYFTGCGKTSLEFQISFSGETGLYPSEVAEYVGQMQSISYAFYMYRVDTLTGAGVDILNLQDVSKTEGKVLSGKSVDGEGSLADYFTLTSSSGGEILLTANLRFDPQVVQNPGKGVYVIEGRFNSEKDLFEKSNYANEALVTNKIIIGYVTVEAKAAFEIEEANEWNMAMNQSPAQIYENFMGEKNNFADCLFTIDSVKGARPGCIPDFYIDVVYRGRPDAVGSESDKDVLKLGETSLRVGPFTAEDLDEFEGCVPTCVILDSLHAKDIYAKELGQGTYGAVLLVDYLGTGVIKTMSADTTTFNINSDWGYKVDMKDWDLRIATPAPDSLCQYTTWGPATGLNCLGTPPGYTTKARITYAGTNPKTDSIIGLPNGYWDLNCDSSKDSLDFTDEGVCQAILSGEYPEALIKGCGDYFVQLYYCNEDRELYYPASDTMRFEICAKYPITIDEDSVKTCVDPICPDSINFKLTFQNERVIEETGIDSVCVAFFYLKGDSVLAGENYTLPVDIKSTQTWAHSLLLDANLAMGAAYHKVSTEVPFTLKADTVGTGTYLVYTFEDPQTHPEIEGRTHGLILGIDTVVFEIECCDTLDLLIDREILDLPDVVCVDDTTQYIDLRLFYGEDVICDDAEYEFFITGPYDKEGNLLKEGVLPHVRFGTMTEETIEINVKNIAKARKPWPPYNPQWPPHGQPEKELVKVQRHQLLFSGEGEGIFYIHAIAEGLCGDVSSDTVKFNLDIVKTFTKEMYEQDGKVFYVTNGNTFDLLPLSNDSIPVAHAVGTAVSIYDPNKLVAHIEGEDNPFYFDWRRRDSDSNWIDIVIMRADTTETGLPEFNLPTLYLENGTEVQEPLAVWYQYFYHNPRLPICCDDNENLPNLFPFGEDWFNLDPWSHLTVFPDYVNFLCTYGKFYVIVKPNDDAIDNNLVAQPVVTETVCYTEGETIDLVFDAVYDEEKLLENGALLPTYYAITYEVRYVDGDDILVYADAANQPDTVSYLDASLAVTWSPVVKGVGQGTYMVTPYYVSNDLMSPTHTRGVATIFTVKSRQGLSLDMVGLNDATFIYKNGDEVPAISLDTNLPAGAIISWTKDVPEIEIPEVEEGEEVEIIVPNTAVGTVEAGNNYIPAFIATNTTGALIEATYTFTIKYVDDLGCDSKIGSFTIQVLPNIVEDMNLIADAVADQTICKTANAAFNYTFSAEYYGREEVEGIAYRVEFAHGDNIVDLATQPAADGTWAPVAAAAGTGTYRVVPTVENGQGQAVTFTLTALEPLTTAAVGVEGNTYTYLHGETVPAISLDTNLPEGTVVTWTVTGGEAIGMNAAAGNAIVPSFIATNKGVGAADDLTATVSYTVAYVNMEGCGASGSFTIVVTPRQEVDTTEDLAAAVAAGNNQVVCNGTAFTAMSFSSAITAGTEENFAGNVTYTVEFIGGTPILDLTAATASAAIGSAASWAPVQAKDGNNNAVNGTGVYRVTPSCNRLIGISTTFTLTTNPFIDNSMITPANVTYYNGDVAPAYVFDAAGLPAGAVVYWKLTAGAIGSATEGNTRIPSFVAINTTTAAISATYEAWIAYKNCEAATPVTFTITVEPKTLSNIDLLVAGIEDQTVCGEAAFEAVVPNITHRFIPTLTGATSTDVFVSGKDVRENADEVGTGIYEVTPFWNNYQGASVQYSLTRLAAPQVNDIADLPVLCNGDAVSVSFSSKQAGTEFDWVVKEADHKLSGIAMSGTGSIDWASVSHKEATPQTITISVTPRNPSIEAVCEGTAKEFTVTVNPIVKVNPIANILVEFPTTSAVAAFEITGVADKYTYTFSDPSILKNPAVATTGEIVAVDGKFMFPALEVRNLNKDEVATSAVTITPSYGECKGEAIDFHIIVLTEMEGFGLEGVDKIEVCEGEETGIIRLGVPYSSFYFVTWTGGADINLPDSKAGERNKSIPSFEAKTVGGVKTVRQITVTPHVEYNGQIFDGSSYAITFPITVYPTLNLQDDETVEIVRVELSTCPEAVLPEFTLTVPEIAGATYQWYKNNVMIASATKNVYKRTNVTLTDAGEYYCIITGEGGCGTANSKTFKVEVIEHINDVIVEQTFADVLQVDNSDNQFTAFKWFYSANGVKGGSVSGDQGLSWIRINSADLAKTFVVEAIDRLGKTHVSCEVTLVAAIAKASIAAYQQEAGSVVATVTGMNDGSIQLVSATGSIVSTTAIAGAETTISVPSAGIYVLRAIPATEGSTAEVKVIVK